MDPFERGYGDVSRVAEQRVVFRGGWDATEEVHAARQASYDPKFPVGDVKDAKLVDGLPCFISSFVPRSPDDTLTPIVTSMAGMTRREKLRVAGIIQQVGDGTPGNLPSFAVQGSVVPAKKTSKINIQDGDRVMAGLPVTYEGQDGRQHGTGFANGRDGISEKFIGPSMYVLRYGDVTARFSEMQERITQLVRDTLRSKMGRREGDWDFPGNAAARQGLDGKADSYFIPLTVGRAHTFTPANANQLRDVVNFVEGQPGTENVRILMMRYFYPSSQSRAIGGNVDIGQPAANALGLERRTAFLSAVAKIAEDFDPVEAGFWNPMTRVAFLLAASWNAGNYLWAALPSDGDPPVGLPPIEQPEIQMAVRAAWDHTIADAVSAPFVADQLYRQGQLQKLATNNPIETGAFAPMLVALMEEERHRINSMMIGKCLGFSPANNTEWDCLVGVHEY